MRDRIYDMLVAQDDLNTLTSGPDWTNGITNKGKEINWLRCIRREAMELIDSFPWEHWKAIGKEADINNAMMELIDLTFFTLSYSLSIRKKISTKDLATQIANVFSMRRLTVNTNIVELGDALIAETFKNDKKDLDLNIFYLLTKIMDGLGINFDILERLYYGKHALNRFRQDNGYKEGKYKKIWDGREDNVYLIELVKSNHIVIDDFYSNLENIYKRLS